MKTTLLSFCISLYLTCSFAQKPNWNSPPDFWLKNNKVIEHNIHSTDSIVDISSMREASGLDSIHYINFNESIRIKSTDDILQYVHLLKGSNRFSFFTVFKNNNLSTEERGIWGVTSSSKKVGLSTRKLLGPKRALNYKGGDGSAPMINAVVQYWPEERMDHDSVTIFLGNLDQQVDSVLAFDGLLGEFIVFNRAITLKERHRIESYLALKYGITLPELDYINSDYEKIWDYSDNVDFHNRIAGIGRDDEFFLYQKQSSSTCGTGLLTIGVNKIESANRANHIEIINKEYLVWGDNGGLLTLPEIEKVHHTNQRIFDRRWLMKSTGRAIRKQPTQIKLDANQLVKDVFKYNYYLLINKMGENSFGIGNMVKIPGSDISNEGIVYFDNVIWDADESGTDMFTFALEPVRQPSSKGEYRIFPNPSTGKITIDIELLSPSPLFVQIFDLNGKLINELRQDVQRKHLFNFHFSNAGTYIMELKTIDDKVTKELIILDANDASGSN